MGRVANGRGSTVQTAGASQTLEYLIDVVTVSAGMPSDSDQKDLHGALDDADHDAESTGVQASKAAERACQRLRFLQWGIRKIHDDRSERFDGLAAPFSLKSLQHLLGRCGHPNFVA